MRVIVGVVPIIRADTVDAGVEQAGVQEVYIGLPGLVLLVQHCDTMCVAVLVVADCWILTPPASYQATQQMHRRR